MQKNNNNKTGLDLEISRRHEASAYYHVWTSSRYFNYVIAVNFKSTIAARKNTMNKKNILTERDTREYFNYELLTSNAGKCTCIFIANEGIA